jgi:hypothetical protein
MRHDIAFALSLLLLAAGCDTGQNTAPEDDGLWEVLDDEGRADNYISTNAREFTLSGVAHITLEEGFVDLEEEARQSQLDMLVDSRLQSVARSIRAHIETVLRDANDGATGEDVTWFTYFRRGTEESFPAEIVSDTQARFTFEMELVGSVYLMSLLAPESSSTRSFTVQVTEWTGSDPEDVVVQIAGSDSRDAFPRYDQLFADGVYDIAVHFGGDYNTERFDLDTARWLVEYLLEGGWANESVTTFEELGIDSPPFTRSLLLEGDEIEARVYIYHSDMVDPSEEERLSEVMRTSFAERDVVIYSGHAGEGAGFILDYQPRHEIRASDFANLEMRDTYQIFVLDGCRTYRTYVDDLMKNENKTFENVDIMTTVNTTPFSVGYQTIHEFIYWLTLTDSVGSHFPLSWKTILRGLNTRQFNSVHYGVHGIDENPRLNPHGSEGIACRPCTSDADCGAGGNLCLNVGGAGICGVACTTDTACDPGFRCARLTDLDELFYIPRQCIPRSYVCE